MSWTIDLVPVPVVDNRFRPHLCPCHWRFSCRHFRCLHLVVLVLDDCLCRRWQWLPSLSSSLSSLMTVSVLVVADDHPALVNVCSHPR